MGVALGRLIHQSFLKTDCRPRIGGPVPDTLVRSQLENLLASELFSRSERLSAFLRFVVEETLNGRGETLKEPVLAHQLYGKEPDFDGASNPIVRVDARRLRDKLREYYADRTADPVVISLPKGSYVPAFELIAVPLPLPASNLAVPAEPADFAFLSVPRLPMGCSRPGGAVSVWRALLLRLEWWQSSPAATQRFP